MTEEFLYRVCPLVLFAPPVSLRLACHNLDFLLE